MSIWVTRGGNAGKNVKLYSLASAAPCLGGGAKSPEVGERGSPEIHQRVTTPGSSVSDTGVSSRESTEEAPCTHESLRSSRAT